MHCPLLRFAIHLSIISQTLYPFTTEIFLLIKWSRRPTRESLIMRNQQSILVFVIRWCDTSIEIPNAQANVRLCCMLLDLSLLKYVWWDLCGSFPALIDKQEAIINQSNKCVKCEFTTAHKNNATQNSSITVTHNELRDPYFNSGRTSFAFECWIYFEIGFCIFDSQKRFVEGKYIHPRPSTNSVTFFTAKHLQVKGHTSHSLFKSILSDPSPICFQNLRLCLLANGRTAVMNSVQAALCALCWISIICGLKVCYI